MKNVALIVAAGKGTRFGEGEVPKQFLTILDRPLLSWTISRFEQAKSIDHIVIVTAEEYLLYVNNSIVNPYGFKKVLKIVPGGNQRAESVYKGLQALPLSTPFVAIHDGVRPLVKPDDIDRVMDAAREHRAAVLGRPVTDTLKRVRSDFIIATVEREGMYRSETPQAFQYDLIREAHEKEAKNGFKATDDAVLVESLGFKVKMVSATGPNLKVTTPQDLELAKFYLEMEK